MRYEDLPDNLTIKELKDYLRLGWNKTYEVANEIPCYKAGNKKIFPKERVREWVKRQSEGQKRLSLVR